MISKEKLQQLIEKVCLDVDQVSDLRKRRRPTTDMGVELEDQAKKKLQVHPCTYAQAKSNFSTSKLQPG